MADLGDAQRLQPRIKHATIEARGCSRTQRCEIGLRVEWEDKQGKGVYACYVCYGYITAEAYTHIHSGRAARAGAVWWCAAALGALSRGVVSGTEG